MSKRTIKATAMPTVAIFCLELKAAVLPSFDAQSRRIKQMVISTNDLIASALRSPCLSATSASTRISACPASDAPVNEPAMPGIIVHKRQNPAVIP